MEEGDEIFEQQLQSPGIKDYLINKAETGLKQFLMRHGFDRADDLYLLRPQQDPLNQDSGYKMFVKQGSKERSFNVRLEWASFEDFSEICDSIRANWKLPELKVSDMACLVDALHSSGATSAQFFASQNGKIIVKTPVCDWFLSQETVGNVFAKAYYKEKNFREPGNPNACRCIKGKKCAHCDFLSTF